MIAANHIFCPCFPVPHDEVEAIGRVIDEHQYCGCESGTGQLDLYDVDHPLSLVIRPIECVSKCAGVGLPIGHLEELYRE